MPLTTHTFTESKLDITVCGICKRTRENHKCDVCDKTHVTVTKADGNTHEQELPIAIQYGNMLFCEPCWIQEEKSSAEHMSPEAQQARVNALAEKNRIEIASLAASRQLDESVIQVRSDVFNAKTQAIVDLKKSIDEDSGIENKPYTLAEKLMERFTHLKSVVFDLQQQLTDAGNEQKAIQIYLNQMANTLRAEEREKLKIQDINYKPQAPRKVESGPSKPRKPKLDKEELRKYAKELGISEFTLQMLVVSKGVTVETAANMLRRSIKEAQSIDDVPND